MYDPKGESASTTRAVTANASSNAIRDDELRGWKNPVRRTYCIGGPALVPVRSWALWRGALESRWSSRSRRQGSQPAGSGFEAESPRGSASDKLDSTSITVTT